jgi:iduronate 2-sulfatase
MDGMSLVPVLRDPAARVRDHAYHTFPRHRQGQLVIGRAIRTERHRLVEWKAPGAPAESADLEVYDYEGDPQETRNLAKDRPDILAQMRAILARHPEAKSPADKVQSFGLRVETRSATSSAVAGRGQTQSNPPAQ